MAKDRKRPKIIEVAKKILDRHDKAFKNLSNN